MMPMIGPESVGGSGACSSTPSSGSATSMPGIFCGNSATTKMLNKRKKIGVRCVAFRLLCVAHQRNVKISERRFDMHE